MENAIFCGSMRPGGNSFFAAQLVAKTIGNTQIYNVSQEQVKNCLACDYCASHPGQCLISKNKSDLNHMGQDKADFFMQRLFAADKIFIIAPIYYYALPGTFKSFVDRAQAWFYMPEHLRPGRQGYAQGKNCGIILIGAREQGEKLFESARLSLKYFLNDLGYQTLDPLYLYGLDAKSDLEKKTEYHQRIIDYAKNYRYS